MKQQTMATGGDGKQRPAEKTAPKKTTPTKKTK